MRGREGTAGRVSSNQEKEQFLRLAACLVGWMPSSHLKSKSNQNQAWAQTRKHERTRE